MANYLKDLMAGGFQGSPGYQFALDQGQQSIRRRNPGMRGSGNVLAALTQHAVGSAQQDYGNEFQRRLAADSLDQQGELARGRLALDDRLGTGALGVSRDRASLDRTLGTGRLDLDRELGRGRSVLDRDKLGLDAARTMGELDINDRRAGIDEQQGWWNYDLGRRRLNLDTAGQENTFNTARDRNAVDWYGARTNRGAARSQDYDRRQRLGNRDPWGGGY